MKKDPIISGLIREAGIEKAPEGFTAGVMDRITAEPEKKKAYRPPIGRRGWWFIGIISLALMLVIGFAYEPGSSSTLMEKLGAAGEWQLPKLHLDLSRISFSWSIAAGLVAIFMLVLAATRQDRRSVA